MQSNTLSYIFLLHQLVVVADVVKCGKLLQCSVRHQNFQMLVCQEVSGQNGTGERI